MNHSYDSLAKNLDQDKVIYQEAFGIGKFLKGNIQLGTYHLEHPISNIRLSDLTHQDSRDYSYLGQNKSQVVEMIMFNVLIIIACVIQGSTQNWLPGSSFRLRFNQTTFEPRLTTLNLWCEFYLTQHLYLLE